MIHIDAKHNYTELDGLLEKPVQLNISFQAKDANEMSSMLLFLASTIEDIVISMQLPWEEPKK